jgi:hypothetical protein
LSKVRARSRLTQRPFSPRLKPRGMIRGPANGAVLFLWRAYLFVIDGAMDENQGSIRTAYRGARHANARRQRHDLLRPRGMPQHTFMTRCLSERDRGCALRRDTQARGQPARPLLEFKHRKADGLLA